MDRPDEGDHLDQSTTRPTTATAATMSAAALERTPPSNPNPSWTRYSHAHAHGQSQSQSQPQSHSQQSQHSLHSSSSQPLSPTLSLTLLSEQSEAPLRWSPSYETPVASRSNRSRSRSHSHSHRSQPNSHHESATVRQLQPEHVTGIPLSSPINGHQQTVHMPRHSSSQLRALNDSSTDSPPLLLNDSLVATFHNHSSPGPILTSPSGLPSALPPELAQLRQITTPRPPLPSPWPARGIRMPILARSFSMSASDADSQASAHGPTAMVTDSASTSAAHDSQQHHHWATKDTPSRMPRRTRQHPTATAGPSARAIGRAQSMPATLDSPSAAHSGSSPLLGVDSPLVGRARGASSIASSASLALTLPSAAADSASLSTSFSVSTCSTCLDTFSTTNAQSMCTCRLLADSNSMSSLLAASSSINLKTPTKRTHAATRRRRTSPTLSTISGSDTGSGSATDDGDDGDDDNAATPRASHAAAAAAQSHRHRAKRSNTSTGDMSPLAAPPAAAAAATADAPMGDEQDTQVVPGAVTQFTLSHFSSISLSSLDSASTAAHVDTCLLLAVAPPSPTTSAAPTADADLASLLANKGPTHFQNTMQASIAAVDMATTPNLGFRSARPGAERKPVVSAEMAESARRLLFDNDLERMKARAARISKEQGVEERREMSPAMDVEAEHKSQDEEKEEEKAAVELAMASPLMDEFAAMEDETERSLDDEMQGLNVEESGALEAPGPTHPRSPDVFADMDDVPAGFAPAAQFTTAGFVSSKQVSAAPDPDSEVQRQPSPEVFTDADAAAPARPDLDAHMARSHSPDPFADADQITGALDHSTAPSAVHQPIDAPPPPTLTVAPGQFTSAVSFARPTAGATAASKGKGKGTYRLSANPGKIKPKAPAAARDPAYLAKLQAELLGIAGDDPGKAPLGGGFGTGAAAFASAASSTVSGLGSAAAGAGFGSVSAATAGGFASASRDAVHAEEDGFASASTDAPAQLESMPFFANARGAVFKMSEAAVAKAKAFLSVDDDLGEGLSVLQSLGDAEDAPPPQQVQQEQEQGESLAKVSHQAPQVTVESASEIATPRRLGSLIRPAGGGSSSSSSALAAPPSGAKRSGFVTPFKSKTSAAQPATTTVATEFATPARPASMAPPAPHMATPSTVGPVRRTLPSISSLAMTPLMTPQSLPLSALSTTRPSAQQPFRTPFKTPRQPSSAAPTPSAGGRRRVIPQPQPKSTMSTPSSAGNQVSSRSVPSVFDLTWQPSVVGKPRRQLRDLGPHNPANVVGTSQNDALHMLITSSVAAATFIFPSLGISGWGPADAHAELVQAGAAPHLISHRWVRNHYRWIVWKLAGYARVYGGGGGQVDAGVMVPKLTRDTVMRQLKYRYEREIVHGHQSALKQILERDELGYRPAVFCVARVGMSQGQGDHAVGNVVLELTDAWYSIQAVPDDILLSAVQRGRIRVGCKLAVSMAPMVNNADGVAAVDAAPDWPPVTSHDTTYDPLDPEFTATAPALKLSCNSTKLARWDAKLGFIGGRRTLPVSLRSLSPNGSAFSEIGVQVLRVYPLMHMETFPNGERAYRNEREEAEAQRQFDAMMRQQRVVPDARRITRADQVSDEQLAQVIVLGQWDDLRAEVPKADVVAELEARARQVSERELQAARSKCQRNVTPFFRVLVACTRQEYEVREDEWVGGSGEGGMDQEEAHEQARSASSDPVCAERALISVWRPDEAARMEVKEGHFFRILNGIVTAKLKGRLRITANRRTAWIPYTSSKPEGLGGRAPTEYVPRTMVTEYSCLINPALENEARLANPDAAADIPKLTTEVDLRGVILDVRRLANSSAGMDLHLMDATGCGFVVVKLYERMWIPAFHDSLVPGVCVELRNIKTRRMDSRFHVPYLESTEETEIVKVRGVGVVSQERVERGRLAMADPVGRGQLQLGQKEMLGVNIGEFFSQGP